MLQILSNSLETHRECYRSFQKWRRIWRSLWWIRPFSSPDTPSQNYGRFASRWLHLDTFLSRSGSGHFRAQIHLPKADQTTIFVVPESSWRSSYYFYTVWERLALKYRAKKSSHFVDKSNTIWVLLASPSISLEENSTSVAGELSGSTNTVLPRTPIDFVRWK